MSGFLSRMFEEDGAGGSSPHGDAWINPEIDIDGDANADGNADASSSSSSESSGDHDSSISDQSIGSTLTADAGFDVTIRVESGGNWDDGDSSGNWSRVDQVSLNGDTDALLGGVLDHGSSDYSADG